MLELHTPQDALQRLHMGQPQKADVHAVRSRDVLLAVVCFPVRCVAAVSAALRNSRTKLLPSGSARLACSWYVVIAGMSIDPRGRFLQYDFA